MTVISQDDERLARRPDIVLFDLDNTIYPYEPAHRVGLDAAMEQIRAEYGLRAEEVRKQFDEAREAVKHRLGKVASSHSRLLYFHALLERLGMGSQVDMALRLEQIYWGNYLAAMRPSDEAKRLLQYLKSAGIGLGLVTDLTAQIQFRKLVFLNLQHAFDWVITSEEAGGDKITGLPYALARQKIGWIDTDTVWMIGDSHVDIEPARAEIGALTFLFTGYGAPDRAASPNVTFADFTDILAAVERGGFSRPSPHPVAAAR